MNLLRDFTAKARQSHAVFSLWVYIPAHLPFLFTLNHSSKDIAGSDITKYT